MHVEFNSDFITVKGTDISLGVKAKPVDGQANKEIIKRLAKHFGTSSRNIVIRKGHKSRDKIVEIV